MQENVLGELYQSHSIRNEKNYIKNSKYKEILTFIKKSFIQLFRLLFKIFFHVDANARTDGFLRRMETKISVSLQK